MKSVSVRLVCSVLAGVLAFAPTVFAAGDDDWKAVAPLASGERIFVGKLTQVIAGPVGLSEPPLRTYQLAFVPSEMLRGAKPDTRVYHYQVRQQNAPEFPLDKTWLVAVKLQEKHWVVTHLAVADKTLIARAKTIAALPAGWGIEDGKPVSPWASLGGKSWPEGVAKPKGPACSKSGRPALLCGEAIVLNVEQVIPAQVQKFKNPFGDGQFKVTVTNRGDKLVSVPALLTDGKTIFWADSLFVLYKGEARLLPGAGKATAAQAVQLKPGESVSTVIDLLPLDRVDWPRGGSRVYFDFALGEKTASNFFYYFSNLHDSMREAALKRLKEGKQ